MTAVGNGSSPEEGGAIRLPRFLVATLRKIRSARDELFRELGRDPTDEEVGERLDLSASKVRHLRRVAREPASLDGLFAAGFDVEDPDAVSPLEAVLAAERREAVRREVALLEPIEARVLRLRFGFDGRGRLTYREVGRAIGLSAQRAHQIHDRALRRLRARVFRGGLREGL